MISQQAIDLKNALERTKEALGEDYGESIAANLHALIGHNAALRNQIAQLETDHDAVRQALAEAGHPVDDLSLAECVKAQEADVRNWMDIARQQKAERDDLRKYVGKYVDDFAVINQVMMEDDELSHEFLGRKMRDTVPAHIRDLRTANKRLEAELDALRDTVLHLERDLGELLALLRVGAGEDSPEYAAALELIGAVPSHDISTPSNEDLARTRTLVSACTSTGNTD